MKAVHNIIIGLLLFISLGKSNEQVLQKILTDPFLLDEGAYLNKNYSCSPTTTQNNVNFHLRGTSLGGWLVLEPWITPSLFYQFLGASEKWGKDAKDHVAIDSLTFCTALGNKEANRQLKIHWQAWVSEKEISHLASIGVETLRIPVADWMFIPYEPFIGCWDGSVDELNRVLALCEKYKLKVLLDLHALRGSQNGLDNSGTTGHYHWHNLTTATTSSTDSPTPSNTFLTYEHWNIRGGDWIGQYNELTQQYETVNNTHLLHTLSVIQTMIDLYGNHPVVIGLEPVNEPSGNTPWYLLKEFYHRVYHLVTLQQPTWLVLFHDGFHLDETHWGAASGLFTHCPRYAVDAHFYQAWLSPPTTTTAAATAVINDDINHGHQDLYIQRVCGMKDHLLAMEAAGVPIIVGEWSLAKDNCAMWLNGLNDNVPTFPKVTCQRILCADSYMGNGVIPNTPPDASKGRQDPYGLGGDSYVEYGTCPIDSPVLLTGMISFANAQLHLYDQVLHGQFFWTFRTELETTWDYAKAVAIGWLPTVWYETDRHEAIVHACDGYATTSDNTVPTKEKVGAEEDELTREEVAWVAWYHKEKNIFKVILILFLFFTMFLVLFYAYSYLAVWHQSYMANAPPVEIESGHASTSTDWRSALMKKQRSGSGSRRGGYQAIPDTEPA